MSKDRALLLVDHGSRVEAANRLVVDLAREIGGQRPDWVVEYAHMEVVPPGVLEGIDACCAAGASDIIVHPYFLGSGRHTSETIPALVEEARVAHPDVRIRVSAPLGPDPQLAELVLERVGAVDRIDGSEGD
jgi:sirohydrochlorin ferrochelatase